MKIPAFFDQAPTITVLDPLACFLGAAEEGIIEYRYLDAVKLAGHSCPTVAGAYLMTRRALHALYPDTLAVRGEIAVAFHSGMEEGTTGVMGTVAGLITGAAGSGGFQGLGGRFRRRGLLTFGADIDHVARFTRQDTGAAVGVTLYLDRVPPDPKVRELMPALLAGDDDPDRGRQFRMGWQERVCRILIDHADDEALIELDLK